MDNLQHVFKIGKAGDIKDCALHAGVKNSARQYRKLTRNDTCLDNVQTLPALTESDGCRQVLEILHYYL